MANTNNDGVKLGLMLNPVDLQKVKQQLDNLIQEYSNKKIELKIDTTQLGNVNAAIKNINSNIQNIGSADTNNVLAKVSSTFTNGELVKSVQQIKEGIGKVTTITKTLSEETQQLSNETVTVTNNYEAQRKTVQKLAEDRQKLADQMANGRIEAQIKRERQEQEALAAAMRQSQKEAEALYEAEVRRAEDAVRAEQQLAEAMARGRERSETRRAKEDSAWELKQSQAINKALDAQYKSLELLEKQRTEQTSIGGLIDDAIQLREQEAKQFSKLLQAQMQSRVNTEKTIDGADKLVNKMKELGSNELNQTVFKKNKGLKAEFDALNDELAEYTIQLKNGTITQEEFAAQKFDKRIGDIASQLKVSSNEMNDFTTKVIANIKAFASWYIIGGIVAGVTRSIKAGIATISDLDAKMVELRKVTDESEASYQRFYYRANETAKAIGQSTEAVMNATASWAQMGYSIKEAEELAKGSAIFSNISENMDISEATKTMISAIKAYGIEAEDAIGGVVDKVNQLSNKFSVTNSDLAAILARSASAMSVANNSIDQLLALGTAANEIVQDSDMVGTALKTISLRLMQVDEDTGQVTEDSKKLSKSLKELTGISIFEADGTTLKSTYEILKEISKIFDTLSDSAQANVLEIIGGKQRANVVSAILQNFATAENALTESINSAGSAAREQATYMDSINAKVNAFKETIIGFWMNLINTDSIKLVVDSATTLVEVLDKLINSFDGLGAKVIGLIILLKTFQGIINSKIAITIANTLATQGLAGAFKSLFVSIPPATAATTADTAATEANTTAKTANLLISNKLLLVIGLVIAAGYGLYKLYDLLTTSVEEHREQLAELKNDYQDILTEIDTIKTELGNVHDRIDELNKFDKLSFVDEQELQNLREYSDELERQLHIAEAREKIAKKSMYSEFVDTMDADLNSEKQRFYSSPTGNWFDASTGIANESQYIEIQFKRYEQFKDKYKKAIEDGDEELAETLRESIDNIENYFATKYDEWKADSQNIDYIENPTTDLEKAVNERLDIINDYNDRMAIAVSEGRDQAVALFDAFERVSSKKEFSGLVNTIKTLGDNVDLTEQKFQPFINALINCGFISDDSSESLQQIKNAFNDVGTSIGGATENITAAVVELKSLKSIYDDLKDKTKVVATAQRELSEDGKITFETMMDLVDAGVITEDQFIKTADGFILSNDALDNLNFSVVKSYELAENEARIAASKFIEQEGRKQYAYKATTDAILEQIEAQGKLLEFQYNMYFGRSYANSKNDSFGLKQNRGFAITPDGEVIYEEELKEKIAFNKQLEENLKNALSNKQNAQTITEQIRVDTITANNKKSSNQKEESELDILNKAFQKFIEDKEHEIFVLSKKEGTEQQRINLLKELQKALHDQAELYRSMGEGEDSDYIQELQKKWFELNDNIIDINNNIKKSNQDRYEDTVTDIEHEIFLLSKKEGTEQKQIELYRLLQQNAHEYAEQLRSMGYEEASDEIQKLQKDWYSWDDAIKKILDDTQKNIKDTATDTLNTLNDIIDITKKIIKQEKEDQIDGLKKQIDAYEKIIDLKKESLKQSQKESDYNDDVAEQTAQIAELQAQINLLSLDDSREAAAQRIDLEKQLAEKQKQLSDIQSDYAVDATEKALDDQLNAYKESKQKEIDIFENALNDEMSLYNEAISLIENDFESLQAKLINYYASQGKTITDTIVAGWQSAIDAVKQYSSVAGAITGLTNLSNTTTNSEMVTALVNQMKSNSSQWLTSSESERTQLAAFNEKIAEQISALIGKKVVKDAVSGIWYIESIGGEKLYSTYHQGGFVGETPTLKQNEVAAILKNDEYVLTDKDQQKLIELISMNPLLNNTFDFRNLFKKIFPYRNISNTNNATNGYTFNPTVNVVIHGDVEDISKAKEYGKQIADATLKQFEEAFSRMGINSSRNARLRPV